MSCKCFICIAFRLKFMYANSVDPDQTPFSTASELGLHCLHESAKSVSSLKRVIALLLEILKIKYSLKGYNFLNTTLI